MMQLLMIIGLHNDPNIQVIRSPYYPNIDDKGVPNDAKFDDKMGGH